MKVVITGGLGFIGGHVAEALKGTGVEEIVVFDKYQSKYVEDMKKFCCVWTGSVLGSVSELEKAFEGADYVFHLAAVSNTGKAFENPVGTVAINVLGTANVLQAARNCKVKMVLIASSSLISGMEETHHIYTSTKLMEEKLAEDFYFMYGLKYIVCRYGICYGERMTPGVVVDTFIKRAIQNEPLEIEGNSKQWRQYLYVKDLAKAHVKILEWYKTAWKLHSPFNIVPEGRTTIKEMAEVIADRYGVDIKYKKARKYDLAVREIDPWCTEHTLGWKATTSLRDGLNKTMDWYEENWKRYKLWEK